VLSPPHHPPRSPPFPYTTLFRSHPNTIRRKNHTPDTAMNNRSAQRRCASIRRAIAVRKVMYAKARITTALSEVPIEPPKPSGLRSEEHTSELQSRENLVCRLLLE